MPFSEEVVHQAWERAGGRCECMRSSCGHNSRCNASLVRSFRGEEMVDGWEAHHIIAGKKVGVDEVNNCEILCFRCYAKLKGTKR